VTTRSPGSLPRTDAPKSNRDPAEVERKTALLFEPHVAPLTALVERTRATRPEAYVPYFDPTEAGIDAKILILLEAPGRRSALPRGSGFVSADNDDETAKNMWQLMAAAGIDRARDVVTWNVVPWYIGDGTKIRPAAEADFDDARAATLELVALLPEVRVVLLLGRKASDAWRSLDIDLPALQAPHPSPLSLNTSSARREQLAAALVRARELVA
jgi:hypothetical protein